MKKFLVLYRMDIGEMQKMMASTSAEGKKEEYGGVGGVDEEEHGQLCKLWWACWKDEAGVGERGN